MDVNQFVFSRRSSTFANLEQETQPEPVALQPSQQMPSQHIEEENASSTRPRRSAWLSNLTYDMEGEDATMDNDSEDEDYGPDALVDNDNEIGVMEMMTSI